MVGRKAPEILCSDEHRPGYLPFHLLPGVAGETNSLTVREGDRHIGLDDDGSGTRILKDAPIHVPGLLHLRLGLPLPDPLEDHVPEPGKPGSGVVALQKEEVRAVVDRLVDDLLAPTVGEYDERYIHAAPANLSQECDAVHLRHLVTGNDGIVRGRGKHVKPLQRRWRHLDLKISRLFQIDPGQFEKSWLTIDHKNTEHEPVLHGYLSDSNDKYCGSLLTPIPE
ncbi:hypothetical protein DSECCO2_503310 [anaerobic digester metagenome]